MGIGVFRRRGGGLWDIYFGVCISKSHFLPPPLTPHRVAFYMRKHTDSLTDRKTCRQVGRQVGMQAGMKAGMQAGMQAGIGHAGGQVGGQAGRN